MDHINSNPKETISREPAAGASAEAQGIVFGYRNDPVLKSVNIRVSEGEMVAVVGPNGCGKTTLLRVLCGTLIPQQGQVWLDGQPLSKLPRSTVAKTLAVLTQETSIPFAFTVEQIVLMGRIPYLRPLMAETAHDRAIAHEAMTSTSTDHLARRVFNELSGGEQQRVLLAMALAQQPRLLMLDEPTVHLDISRQIEVLELVRQLNRQRGISTLAVMHDLNLAALYFDRLILVKRGKIVAEGSPSEVLVPDIVEQVFDTKIHVLAHPTQPVPYLVVEPRENNGHIRLTEASQELSKS